MTTSERMGIYFHSRTDETPICINCEHFVRHYIKRPAAGGTGMLPLHCGHCLKRRFRSREAYDSCDSFSNKNKSPAGAGD